MGTFQSESDFEVATQAPRHETTRIRRRGSLPLQSLISLHFLFLLHSLSSFAVPSEDTLVSSGERSSPSATPLPALDRDTLGDTQWPGIIFPAPDRSLAHRRLFSN